MADVGEIACAAGFVRLTSAVAEPVGPVAVMETVDDAGMVAGAVNSPFALIEPALAVQLVAPGDVNSCVWPRVTDTAVGDIVC